MKALAKVLMILLLIWSPDIRAQVKRKIELHDTHLLPGQRAPWEGVLLPQGHYVQCDNSMREQVACEQALQESISSGMSFGDYAVVFSLGAIFGALTYIALQH